MTPADVVARVLAAALLDGEWEPVAMRGRAAAALGSDRRWLQALARAACRRFAAAPADALGELAAWIRAQRPFVRAVGDRRHPIQVVRYPTPAPEMRESPWQVPPLATSRELATWLDLDLRALEVLADRRNLSRASPHPPARHYRHTWIPKPAGGHRLVEAPKPRLRAAQRRILDGILAAIPPHDAAHGFRAGRSVIGFAALHVGRDAVLRLDLEAFFASVVAARVSGLFRVAGYPEEVARTLAALCTHRTPADVLAAAPAPEPTDLARLRARHLPQGAPTSGALANLAAYRLDVRLAALAATLGARYGRYADDLVLSGDRTLLRAAPSVIARVGAIAFDEGFTLNFRKTRVMSAARRQRVTGVVVNRKPSPPRADVERLRAILHNCLRTGPAAQNRDGHPDFRAHLAGRISWIASLAAAKGARLRAAFDRIAWKPPAAASGSEPAPDDAARP
ncbi:MAG TPA: reverse transcriptase family protein [Kofleriaceae bacterium]|nr:reverse transcriptase family protein [Kofleriaceae bacterium]